MRNWLMGMLLTVLPGLAQADTAPAAPPLVVVELFTSQGCSSCPPADAVLRQLAARPGVLALGFHVTYWNGLGWRDPFSFEAATQRQRQYQNVFSTSSISTPQLVVQGQAEMVGSDRATVEAALRAAMQTGGRGPSVALATSAEGFKVDIGPGSGAASVLLVGFDPLHTTPVGRGENAGRTLQEANVVRSLRRIGSWDGARLSLAAPVPDGERAAILLQAADGRIIAAALPTS